MSEATPLKLALLWHMHQPNYQEPGSRRLMLPWVRLHATKDYLDMLLRVRKFPSVRVTFNLVPSLLDQLELYLEGGTDPHLELSRADATTLSPESKREMLATFFMANQENLIASNERYRQLYNKAGGGQGERLEPALFTSEELRDLQVWSNLAWVDPMFHDEEPIRSLLRQQRHYTEQQKHSLLDWQLDLIRRIIPAYQDFVANDCGEVSFTPYYHPILPLLCDTDSARQAIPNIELPEQRFAHPEDSLWHIRASMQRYEELFGRPMAGMWPSEGSVSSQVGDQACQLGLKWIATDEEILFYSLRQMNQDPRQALLHTVYDYGPGLRVFFRDHALSDRIGFVYSGWEPTRAVNDFMEHLRRLRDILHPRLEQVVVPVILDGENAWEYFAHDGAEFLDGLYEALEVDPTIETVTFSEAADHIAPSPLSALFAGSWINHSFRIWIGHHEDNAAWNLLSEARRMLVRFEKEHPDFPPDKLRAAWRQIYIAEGSDWCWWFGDEHRGANNAQFDAIFRRHLTAVYEVLGLDIPVCLLNPIHHSGATIKPVLPDSILTPRVDGTLTHFYEWAGAGYFNCLPAGGAMHRVDRHLAQIYFAYDHDNFYIRLDFNRREDLDSLEDAAILLQLLTPGPRKLRFTLNEMPQQGKHFRVAMQDLMEVAIGRDWLFAEGSGRLEFNVSIVDGSDIIEVHPEGEPIVLHIAPRGRELFWST